MITFKDYETAGIINELSNITVQLDADEFKAINADRIIDFVHEYPDDIDGILDMAYELECEHSILLYDLRYKINMLKEFECETA